MLPKIFRRAFSAPRGDNSLIDTNGFSHPIRGVWTRRVKSGLVRVAAGWGKRHSRHRAPPVRSKKDTMRRRPSFAEGAWHAGGMLQGREALPRLPDLRGYAGGSRGRVTSASRLQVRVDEGDDPPAGVPRGRLVVSGVRDLRRGAGGRPQKHRSTDTAIYPAPASQSACSRTAWPMPNPSCKTTTPGHGPSPPGLDR